MTLGDGQQDAAPGIPPSVKAVREGHFRNVSGTSLFTLLALLVVLSFGAPFAWSRIDSYLASRVVREDTRPTVLLGVGDRTVTAVVLSLRASTSSRGSFVASDEALLVVLDALDGLPLLRNANHPLDVLWLDESLRVVGSLRGYVFEGERAFTVPDSSRYGLMARTDTFPETAFENGTTITVVRGAIDTSIRESENATDLR